MRSPKFWLGLLSTTITATELSGSRSSRVKDGLASASAISANAMVRTAAPRLRDTKRSSANRHAAAITAHRTSVPTRGANAIPIFKALSWLLLLTQALEQRRNMYLIGFVIAGERVHHDVDAGAEREFALARLPIDHRQHRLP